MAVSPFHVQVGHERYGRISMTPAWLTAFCMDPSAASGLAEVHMTAAASHQALRLFRLAITNACQLVRPGNSVMDASKCDPEALRAAACTHGTSVSSETEHWVANCSQRMSELAAGGTCCAGDMPRRWSLLCACPSSSSCQASALSHSTAPRLAMAH